MKVFEQLNRFDGASPGQGRGMPALLAGLNPEDPDPTRIAPSLTEFQYMQMEQWALGNFEEEEWTGPPPPPPEFSEIPEVERPVALDRAALDACIGSPFYPGIEAGFIMARADTYRTPFRIRDSMQPGELTAGNTLPWQADFLMCATSWWPAQRPNSVFPQNRANAQDWVPSDWVLNDRYDHMMANWDRLGFVVKKGDRYVEKERLQLINPNALVS